MLSGTQKGWATPTQSCQVRTARRPYCGSQCCALSFEVKGVSVRVRDRLRSPLPVKLLTFNNLWLEEWGLYWGYIILGYLDNGKGNGICYTIPIFSKCQVANDLFPNGFSCAGTAAAVQRLVDRAGALLKRSCEGKARAFSLRRSGGGISH